MIKCEISLDKIHIDNNGKLWTVNFKTLDSESDGGPMNMLALYTYFGLNESSFIKLVVGDERRKKIHASVFCFICFL